MDVKFILLIIGIFIFTLGYVNQNKYDCNIIPSLNKMQEQDLRSFFNKDSAFMKYKRIVSDKDIITNTGYRPLPIMVSSDDYIDYSDSQSTEYITPGSNLVYGQ